MSKYITFLAFLNSSFNSSSLNLKSEYDFHKVDSVFLNDCFKFCFLIISKNKIYNNNY